MMGANPCGGSSPTTAEAREYRTAAVQSEVLQRRRTSRIQGETRRQPTHATPLASCSDLRPDTKGKNLLTCSSTQDVFDFSSLRPTHCITAAPYVECKPHGSRVFLRSQHRRVGYVSLHLQPRALHPRRVLLRCITRLRAECTASPIWL